MSVKIDNLPETPHGEFLHCWKCGESYSASRGDYFWMSPSDSFECRGQQGAYHRPVTLQLRRRVTFLVPA